MSPVVGFTVAGRAPPPPNHISSPPAPVSEPRLSLDVNLVIRRQEEEVLALTTLPLLVLTGIFILAKKYLVAVLFAALMVMVFLATYYARRPHITHRLARLLRAVFYVSFTYPGDKRPPRLRLRMSVIVGVSILLGLFGSRRG